MFNCNIIEDAKSSESPLWFCKPGTELLSRKKNRYLPRLNENITVFSRSYQYIGIERLIKESSGKVSKLAPKIESKSKSENNWYFKAIQSGIIIAYHLVIQAENIYNIK